MNKITREEEAMMPAFKSHAEAREWFKEKYGDDFMLTDSEIIGGQKCYFYHLILDRAVYISFMRNPQSIITSPAIDYLNSHQAIQIMEDGDVHIVH